MSLIELVNPAIAHSEHAARFAAAQPFPHLALDDFFEHAFVQALLAEFPPFARGNARNEAGHLGGKATVEQIRELGPAYARLDALVQSHEFLALVTRLTGIPELLYDPHYFGGGTHENRAGQELDSHVDFNRHPVTGWHRRLNLIVYLNPEWRPEWGGALELHSDPRRTDDRVLLVQPTLNRCVIFATTEVSWHGFSRIQFPAGEEARSRRSIALYFYTRERPAEELADPHSTIYVDRPLPPHLVAGHTLDADDVAQVQMLIERRDQHVARLYRDVGALTRELEQARARMRMGTLPLLAHYVRRVLGLFRKE